MKLWMGPRPQRLVAGAAGLVGMLVIAIAGASSKPARASTTVSIHAAASAPSITPGYARAETDTLDLQLD